MDTTNQTKAIEYFAKSNRVLHPDLRIARVSWSMRAIKENRPYLSLHIKVETAAMANRLITEGLLENYKMKCCKRFAGDCKVTQCFNCQQYSHILKACRNATKYSHCAGSYSSHDCSTKSNWHYVNCGVAGHEAWSKVCNVKHAQKQHSKDVFCNRPLTYQSTSTYTPSASPTNTFNFQLSVINTQNTKQE